MALIRMRGGNVDTTDEPPTAPIVDRTTAGTDAGIKTKSPYQAFGEATTEPPIGVDIPGGWTEEHPTPTTPSTGTLDPTIGKQAPPIWSPYPGGLAGEVELPKTTTPTPAVPAAAPSGPVNGNYQDWIFGLLKDKPFTQQTLLDLEPVLLQHGIKLTPPNAQGERTKIQLPDGTWVRIGFGEGHPVWVPQGAAGTTGGGSSYNAAYGSNFSDPSTKQLEQFIQQWLAELENQRTAQATANESLKARQAEATASTERLTKFMQERAGRLQGPAYTGAEGEVLRTQALDPIERDRQAARQKVLQNISARGLDPTSGIALDLLNQVDANFDKNRAGAQNDLAYRTINEQRSREQEAQQLLGMIPQAQSAAARGDLEFLQALDAALNQSRSQALPLASLQYELPNRAIQQSLAVLGQGTSPESLFNQAMNLYGANQQGRNQGLQWYEQLGALLPYLTGR